jgi:N-hydroxyarylamine O-acetyltransferase
VLDTAAAASHRQAVLDPAPDPALAPAPGPALDLDAYFARIGYRGPRTATLDALHGIAGAHVQAIPFENLDVLLGRPIDLELGALQRKLVRDRRGGYCFEQNALLLGVLTALGFAARPVSARVRMQRPRDVLPPRTHLFVQVELDGPWLVDVGIGAMSMASAIRLVMDEPQPTPHEPRRLVRDGDRIVHQARVGDDWQDIYETTLEEMPPIDREVASWYTSTHPQSGFRNRLTVARALPDGRRITLRNRELTVRERDGRAEHRVIESPDELLAVLAEQFGLEFPPGTRFPCPALDWPGEG